MQCWNIIRIISLYCICRWISHRNMKKSDKYCCTTQVGSYMIMSDVREMKRLAGLNFERQSSMFQIIVRTYAKTQIMSSTIWWTKSVYINFQRNCVFINVDCWFVAVDLFNFMFLFWTVKYINRIWQLYLIWISVMSYHHIVVCLLQACSKFAGKHVNVCSKLASRFAASLQEAFYIGACEHLQQANSKPNLHGKMFAANMQHICCNIAAMNASLLYHQHLL